MTQLTDKIYAVEMSDDAENIRVSQLIGTPKLFADLPGVLWAVKLPPGIYRFLFTTKTATEEDAHLVVENVTTANELPVYWDYEFSMWMKSAVGSLRSLLRSKGCDPNKNYALIEKQSSDDTE